jgi:hypothetical protein
VHLAEGTLDLQVAVSPNVPTDRPIMPSDLVGAEGISLRGDWRAPAMRGTGSSDSAAPR